MFRGNAGISAMAVVLSCVLPAPGAALPGQRSAGPTSLACFAPFSSVAVGPGPAGVAVGDFNEDGRIDFASASSLSNTVSVRLGDGNGGFVVAPGSSVGTAPSSIVTGDWNADGNLDLAVANSGLPGNPAPGSDDVSILLGDGAGGFGPAQNLPAGGAQPSSIISGDFNRDGRPDLAVANKGASAASILLGDGAGGFLFAGQFSLVFQSVFSIATGDFNGDGNSDLAGTNDFAGRVTVLLGSGTGSFGVPHDFPGGLLPIAVAVGDVNEDGKADLVVANQAGATVSVLLGDGSGAFLPPTAFSAGSGPRSVALADFDSDGHLDIVVANEASSTASVLLGDGGGGFGPAANFPVGQLPRFVAVADFDGDSLPDLAFESSGSNSVSILLNAAPAILPQSLPPGVVNGTYPATQFSGSGGTAPYSFALSGTLPPGLTFNAGTATLSGVPAPPGTSTFSVTVTDVGGCSSTRTYSVTVSPTPTVVVLTSSPNPSSLGQTIQLTATVQPSGPVSPTGTVTFRAGGIIIGTAAMVDGVATLEISTLALGTHVITAQYSGDTNFQPNTSAVLQQGVGIPEIPMQDGVGFATLAISLAAAALFLIRWRG